MSIRALAIFVAAIAASASAWASEAYYFPSANGAIVVTTTTQFGNQQPDLRLGLGVRSAAYGMDPHRVPPPAPTPVDDRFGTRSAEMDGYGFKFLTQALAAASYANYMADYQRLFAPNYALTVWTDRVYGLIGAGYGGPVDGWTSGAYYLGRARGPRIRRESPPDLSTMPKFRPHPELEDAPTFEPN